jgi:uncharacterized protein
MVARAAFMRIVIAGGSGFLGRALSEHLVSAGHRVLALTRRASGSRQPWDEPRTALSWTPDGRAGDWAPALDGASAVVNLAGESIAAGRWTADTRRRITESRVLATRSLVAAIGALRQPPALVSSSAQGFYGDRGDEELDESAAPGEGFLSAVCRRWEEEASAADRVTRVVLLRTGIVLSTRGGALPRMLLPFRLFAGGPLGSGRQFTSWIHLADWVHIVSLAAADDRARGPINLGSPAPVRNRDFAAAIGRTLRRPSVVAAPAFALRLLLGERADELLLSSTRMVPSAALALGYRFRFDDAESALADLVSP